MRTDKMHPLPWKHKTDGKKMSAVVDAEGNVVCGSLICQQSDATKQIQTHAYIVKVSNTRLRELAIEQIVRWYNKGLHEVSFERINELRIKEGQKPFKTPQRVPSAMPYNCPELNPEFDINEFAEQLTDLEILGVLDSQACEAYR